jgi:hypothetical protein
MSGWDQRYDLGDEEENEDDKIIKQLFIIIIIGIILYVSTAFILKVLT